MRLVCPNCVAQYEVADGTIPESGRDVQCANCNHIWFQDAAFKLSTDDLMHVPHKARETYLETYDDEPDDDEPDDDDVPGVFHSQRAARNSGDPADAPERALPEVAGNVMDILRSEAAFSSRRRAEARAEPPVPEQEQPLSAPDDADDAVVAFQHRTGSRAGDLAPPQAPVMEHPETPQRAPDFPAARPRAGEPAAGVRISSWRHLAGGRHDDTSGAPADASAGTDEPGDAIDDDGLAGAEPAEPGFDDATTFSDAWRQDRAADGEDDETLEDADEDEFENGAEQRLAERVAAAAAFENRHGLTGLHADAAKRIADAAVSRSEPEPDAQAAEPRDDAADPAEQVRHAIRRVPVRSLVGAAVTPASDPPHPQDEATDDDLSATIDAARTAPEDTYDEAAVGPYSGIGAETEPELEDQAPEAGPETEAGPDDAKREAAEPHTEAEPEAEAEPDEDAPPPAEIQDQDDIRQVRRSLVENRKVLLPDVDELNTSLRMDKREQGVDLRASAFSEEDLANRNKFWLGLVTALMLFGIVSGLYLMGPAISDVFPVTDPYVSAFRDLVDRGFDATASAWMPVVRWLEAL